MIRVENVEVWGFEHAIIGMRNPLNSWEKSDSDFIKHYVGNNYTTVLAKIGDNDLTLMKKLFKSGSEHRKYLRQIFVGLGLVEAPLYWWKEFDTYKVGTVANSCSTMHKITAKEFTIDDFSHEHLIDELFELTPIYNNTYELTLFDTITALNKARERYLETKDKKYWWQIIQLLPSSYNQRRTITMNYENVVTIIKQRSGHKLDEWSVFIEELKKLPYIKEIMGD